MDSLFSCNKRAAGLVLVTITATAYAAVTLPSGEYSGVRDYSGQKVIIPAGVTIRVKPYGRGNDLSAGRLTIIADEITVAGVIDAAGAGYGGGGGGAGAHGNFLSGNGGSTGQDVSIDGVQGTDARDDRGGAGGAGGGYGGGGGGCGGAWSNAMSAGGKGSTGGGDGGLGLDMVPYQGGGGGGGSGDGQAAEDGGVVTGGMGSAGGGRGGDGASDAQTYWDGGGGGGGGGGPFGGDGGFGGDRSHIDGYPGKPGGYLARGLNGDTSADFSVFMGSGGGGGGGANQGGQVADPCQPLAKGGPGGVEGGNGIHGAGDGGGGGGGGGAAGGGMISLKAITRIDIVGELDVDGGGKAELKAGYGAGGGILLAAPTVTIAQGAVSSLGGNMIGAGTSSNGGSLKIFADRIVGTEDVQANVGRLFTSPYSADIGYPSVAYNPVPVDGAQGVSPSVLRWQAGRTAAYHDVYFGLYPNLSIRAFVGRQEATEYTIPFVLDPGTTYYWRVDEVEADGTTVYPGEVWSFTAGEPVEQVLTISSYGEGSVLTPGEGQFQVGQGTVLTIEAAPADSAAQFQAWTGSAVSQGKVQDPSAARTTVLVDSDYTLTAVFTPRADGPALGFSIGEIEVDDPDEFTYRVTTNNTPEATFVERVTGLEPDPNGMVRMQVVHAEPARAKLRFGPCTSERVLVQFQYLFESPQAVELIVYLSDVPDLLAPDDPQWQAHYAEIGRVPAPPTGRPGAFGSERFGTFQTWAQVQGLDLSNGTWVELELIEAPTQGMAALDDGGGSVLLDDLIAQVNCYGSCLNVTWDTDNVDWQDLALVMAWWGATTELDADGLGGHCLEGIFSDDGYVDLFDITSWTWALEDLSRVDCPSGCRRDFPLAAGTPGSVGSTSVHASGLTTTATSLWPRQLLVLGIPQGTATGAEIQEHCFHLFDQEPNCVAAYGAAGLPVSCDVRVVAGPGGQVYLVSTEQGVLQLSDVAATPVIAPGSAGYDDEPRYHDVATVYVGIQGQGESSFGRPLLDVAFDAQGYAYVVPVVVEPVGREPYVSAAKLRLGGTGTSWQVIQLYDDPPAAADNQRRNYLREIEVDDANNVYVLNVHALNESCILWQYDGAGTMQRRVALTGPNAPVRVEDPVALHVSQDGGTVYVASGQYGRHDPTRSMVYGLSTADFSLTRTITIEQMELATSLTEAPGPAPEEWSLWVAGFRKTGSAGSISDVSYIPYAAKVPADVNTVQAVDLSGRGQHNLALTTSIIWTGEQQ
ncbi:MAG: hypothetical protein JW741_10420 [Sedimentisphaerales bacterium]|nr:hypothetical protein [Sedimentisphaerales bacterium]